jgi:hypothetical protein
MPRQEPGARMGVALAHAYAGRHAEAVRDARTALASQQAHDTYSARQMQNIYGQLLVVVGRQDEALDVLRTVMSELVGQEIPDEVRFHPIWSRLKDDPRFEEILRSAKPL